GARLGAIVRVATMRADSTDRGMVGNQPVFGEVIQDALLNLRFAYFPLETDTLGDEGEGNVKSGTRVPGCLKMHSPLLVVPARFKTLNEVSRRIDFDAEGADQLHRPRIDARHVGIRIPRHIFHGNPAGT